MRYYMNPVEFFVLFVCWFMCFSIFLPIDFVYLFIDATKYCLIHFKYIFKTYKIFILL